MSNAIIASSNILLPFKEFTPTVDGHLPATQRQSSDPAPSFAKSQMVDIDSSQLPLAVERELSLSELASAINCEHQLCQEAYKASLVHARRTGEFLLQAKSKVKESTLGRWLPWLKANCPDLPERTAQAYMQVAREWERVEKSATVADFGLKDAIKFLSETKGTKKPATKRDRSTDITDTSWSQVHGSQEAQFGYASKETLKERDRVVLTEEHLLSAGQQGTITGRPSIDTAIVALDEGATTSSNQVSKAEHLAYSCSSTDLTTEDCPLYYRNDLGDRERILIAQLKLEDLKPQNLVSEPKSKDQQLLPSIEPNLDVPPNEPHPLPASLVNNTAIAQGKPDVMAGEIALGITRLSPQQLAWVISAAANNGLSDAHLKTAVRAAKQVLNHRHHPEYFKGKIIREGAFDE